MYVCMHVCMYNVHLILITKVLNVEMFLQIIIKNA